MSGYFEGKKIAWRQTAKDGIVLALSIHPDDMPKEMAGSALNTRYMMAFVEIGANEPTGEDCSALLDVARLAAAPQESVANGHPKKSWTEIHRSQQAGILCSDPAFRQYFGVNTSHLPEQLAVEKLRDHFRIKSRAELDDPANHARWDEFVALYHLHRDRLR